MTTNTIQIGLSTEAKQKAQRDFLLGMGFLMGTHFAISRGGLMTLFASHLGISESAIGLLLGGPYLLSFARILFLPSISRNCKNKWMFSFYFWSMIFFSGHLILIPVYLSDNPSGRQLAWGILFFTHYCTQLLFLIGNAASQPYILQIVTQDKIGRYHGITRTCWRLFGIILLWASSFILGKSPDLSNYFVLFCFLLLWNITSLFFIRQLPDKGIYGNKANPFWVSIFSLFNNGTFRKLCLFSILTYLLFGLLHPYQVTYLKKLGYPEDKIILFTLIEGLGGLGGSLAGGFMADRGQVSRLMVFCVIAISGSAFFWLFAEPCGVPEWRNYIPVASIFLINGFSVCAFCLAEVFILFSLAPKRESTIYMGVNRAFLPLGFGLGPLFGGILVDTLQHASLTFSPEHILNHYEYLFISNGFLYFLPLALGLGLCRGLQRGKAIAL
jgi:predicted MFS family arabinose efflux permease